MLLAQGGAGVWAYLRGKTLHDALSYLSEKVEKVGKEGGTVKDLKNTLKTPEEGKETQAKALTTFINRKFPIHKTNEEKNEIK